jgi:Fic family protein
VDLDLLGALSAASQAVGELGGLGRTLPNPQLLINPFVRREAVLSSRIEGTQADIAQVYAFEAGQLSLPGFEAPSPSSDVQEVVNYVHALEYGLEAIRDRAISLHLMRELHELLMTGVRGQYMNIGAFREEQNWIGPPGCEIEDARFVPPPARELMVALDSLERYIHREDQYPALIRIGLIHYQFETIHPFLDGNGRIGRLLISLLLIHWKLIPLPLLYLSAFFERHRQEYNDRLLAVSEHGAWNEWLLFFLRGVTELSRDAGDKVKRLQDVQKDWRERLSHARGSSPLLLAEHLFSLPVITIPAAVKVLGVTYPAAQQNVQKLVDVGILRRVGDAQYGKVYVADEILHIVSEGGA